MSAFVIFGDASLSLVISDYLPMQFVFKQMPVGIAGRFFPHIFAIPQEYVEAEKVLMSLPVKLLSSILKASFLLAARRC